MNPFGQKFDAQSVYFTSDTHFNHVNYCRGVSKWENTDRCLDFDNLDEMNTVITKSINDTVTKETDHLFIVGDFCLGKRIHIPEFRKGINCPNVHYCLGNHSYHIRKDPELQKLFTSVQDYLEIFCVAPNINQQCILFHYPMKVWNNSHKKTWALTAHSHCSLPYKDDELGLDLGWCGHKRPYSFWEIQDIMKTKKWKQKDHHSERTLSP